MGIRMDQHRGLNGRASQIVGGCGMLHPTDRYESVEVAHSHNHGDTGTVPMPVLEPCVRREPSGGFYGGMFDDQYPLHKYTFREGGALWEAVQAAPWSSGPVFFLALMDEKGNWVRESLWSDEEVANA